MAPRKKAEPERPAALADDADQDTIVRFVYERFARSIPQAALRAGLHEPDQEQEPKYKEVEDGKYRVVGADWIVHFKAGRVLMFELARAPDFGGKGVVSVPAEVPPQATVGA